jgi:hypothetical protein
MIADVVADRSAAVSELDGDELARRLALQPHLAAWCVGVGPLRVWLGPPTRAPGRRQLGAALANPHALRLTIELLDAAALQLLVVLATHGGTLTPDELADELAPLEASERERLVQGLADRLLVHDPLPGEPLRLRPGVGDLLARPGRPLDRLLLDQTITREVIGTWLGALGVEPVPSGKSARIEALRGVIGSREGLASVLDRLSVAERALFDRLVAAGGRGTGGDRLTANWWQLQLPLSATPSFTRHRVPLAADAASLQRLIDLGLVWVERELRQVGLWLETLVAVQGRTFAIWHVPELIAPVPLHHHAAMHPAALSIVQRLVRQVGTEPIPGLKSGGIGVKAVRDLAKRMDLPAERLEPLVHLALGLGLLTHTSEFIGRGRSGSWVHRYELNRERAEEWTGTSIADQWIHLVDGWLDGLDAPGEHRALESVVRRQLLADLLALPDGHGIPADRFLEWCRDRHGLARRLDLARVPDQLVVLGLGPADGPVGLGALARAVVTEPGSLHELLPTHVDTFVVQADLSVIAPPELDPAVRARLDRLCATESTGTVAVLRLDRTRIAAELAAGDTAQAMLDFLVEHSSVPVAPVVAQLLADVERQRGGLTARAAASVVTADDVLGLAQAVKVRAARLTLVAPTVAVSELPLDKVVAALRRAGLAPTSSTEPAADPDLVVRIPARGRHRDVPEVLHPHLARLEALMEDW